MGYKGFSHQGFRIKAAFDTDPHKVGAIIGGVTIYHLDQLAEIISQSKIRMAMIAVPAVAAQAVADQLVASGIEGIVNFASVTLNLPATVSLVGVDLAMELEQLSFSVANQARSNS